MSPAEAAHRLEAVLEAENAALARHDAAAAAALLAEKLAAASGLAAEGLSQETVQRLRTLAAENRRLLERAILVQGRIVEIVVKAARQSPAVGRYGAKGRAMTEAGAMALIKQA